MSKTIVYLLIILLSFGVSLNAESFRTYVEGTIEINPERPAGSTVTAGINSSVLIDLTGETRFLRGIEIEISAPAAWMQYRGALVMSLYNSIYPKAASGTADFDGNSIAFEPLPSRLQIIYQIPLRQGHGLRTTTTASVPTGIIQSASFPMLLRFMPVMKGLSAELENMTFNVTVRPLLGDEGAVRLIPRYPPNLAGRPFTVLIDDDVIANPAEPVFLREGEHHLVIISEDYRNESRRFIVERARVSDLIIELQDPTPVIIFESPQNSRIFLNNVPVEQTFEAVTVEPGFYEVRFQIGDYTVLRSINVQRGKTYRISLEVDLAIREEE